MRYVVVTTCTDRKRSAPPPSLMARNLEPGSRSQVVAAWSSRIAQCKERRAAEDLYCGRAFSEAKGAADELGADLWIVSAGMGLVKSNSPIPSYSLTTAPRGADAVMTKVQGDSWSSAAWWSAINKRRTQNSICKLFSKYPKATFLIALSEHYAALVRDDLDALDERDLRRLRLFGLSIGRVLGGRFPSAILPYDRRLDGPDSPVPGTLSDFASRAVRHFSQLVQSGAAGAKGLSKDRAAVEDALAGWPMPSVPKREPRTDAELQAIILDQWETVGGRSGQMLRHLRDNLMIACEQSRFRRLFNDVAERQRCL